MKAWILNFMIAVVFFTVIKISDVGIDKAKEYIVKEYVGENSDYKDVLASIEYRDKSLTSDQKKIFISGSREISVRLFDLKVVWWLFNGLLISVFSIVFVVANRSGK